MADVFYFLCGIDKFQLISVFVSMSSTAQKSPSQLFRQFAGYFSKSLCKNIAHVVGVANIRPR